MAALEASLEGALTLAGGHADPIRCDASPPPCDIEHLHPTRPTKPTTSVQCIDCSKGTTTWLPSRLGGDGSGEGLLACVARRREGQRLARSLCSPRLRRVDLAVTATASYSVSVARSLSSACAIYAPAIACWMKAPAIACWMKACETPSP
jgi:hypothetical protein